MSKNKTGFNKQKAVDKNIVAKATQKFKYLNWQIAYK